MRCRSCPMPLGFPEAMQIAVGRTARSAWRPPGRHLIPFSILGLLIAPHLYADGGAVQFREQTGSIVVTLFGSPSPLRTGPADLSVLLETAGGNEPILDAAVSLALRHRDTQVTAAATHAEATNKLLYAALPDLSESGQWQVTVAIERAGIHLEARGTIEVLPGPPAILFYWPYFLVVPLVIGLFALNQWLKKREAAGRHRATPPGKHYHLDRSRQLVRNESQSSL